MSFSPDKYKYFIHQSKDHASIQVTAVSTYAGRTVKGYAKCDPRDEYNEEHGMKLAAARCNQKVAEKRKARAWKKFNEASRLARQAEQYEEDMRNYYIDSINALTKAETDVKEILETM